MVHTHKHHSVSLLSPSGGRLSFRQQGNGSEPGLRALLPAADGYEVCGGDGPVRVRGHGPHRTRGRVSVHTGAGGAEPAADRGSAAALCLRPAALLRRVLPPAARSPSWEQVRVEVDILSNCLKGTVHPKIKNAYFPTQNNPQALL